MRPAEPYRGEVYFADLNPPPDLEQGSEQTGVRPVLILSNNRLNRVTNCVVVVPLSTSESAGRFPTSVAIPQGSGRLQRASFALCQQIRVLDKNRLRDRVGQLPAEIVQRVGDKVAEILELEMLIQ